jgi:hypothetical protein
VAGYFLMRHLWVGGGENIAQTLVGNGPNVNVLNKLTAALGSLPGLCVGVPMTANQPAQGEQPDSGPLILFFAADTLTVQRQNVESP